MRGDPLWDWAWWALGVITALGAVALLIWALWWDRSRGRARCPRCWYSMEGAPSPRCPECGETAPSGRALHRTRRHWGWAGIAAVALAIGAQVFQQPQRSTEGWTRWVPSTILVAAMTPKDPDLSRPTGMVIALRSRQGDLWEWQVLLAHVLDDRATPELIRASLVSRPVWSSGTPVTIALSPGNWSTPNVGTTAVIAGVARTTQPLMSVTRDAPGLCICRMSGGRSDRVVLPGLSPGRHRVEFTVSHVSSWALGQHILASAVVPVEFEVRGRPEELIPGIDDQSLARLIRSQLRLGFVGEDHVLVGDLEWNDEIASAYSRRIFVYPRVELVHDGVVEAELTWRGDDMYLQRTVRPRTGATRVVAGSRPWRSEPQDPWISALGPPREEWTVRVSGDAEGAMQELRWQSCWSGSFEMPLTEVAPPNGN